MFSLMARLRGPTTSIAMLLLASGAAQAVEIVGDATLLAPGIVSTEHSEVRLTLSPDGRTALWFSRNRPGGPGSYDIWMSKQTGEGWGVATPVPFNSPQRDFDPAFSADGKYVYFCSDRPGGLGGDDLYRVNVRADGFGAPEHLGPEVNSAGNEWAPMLSPDQRQLIFSSNGRGGKGNMDLFVARRAQRHGFEPATPLPGDINTPGEDFDATFLSNGTTLVFSRAADFETDKVRLFAASLRDGRYDAGALLPESVNAPGKDTYAPMLDWSHPDRITFTSQRPEAHAGSVDVYTIRYRLTPR